MKELYIFHIYCANSIQLKWERRIEPQNEIQFPSRAHKYGRSHNAILAKLKITKILMEHFDREICCYVGDETGIEFSEQIGIMKTKQWQKTHIFFRCFEILRIRHGCEDGMLVYQMMALYHTKKPHFLGNIFKILWIYWI